MRALLVALVLAGCVTTDDVGEDGQLVAAAAAGQGGRSVPRRPPRRLDTSRTQVWKVTAQWEDNDTAARRPGMAWPANSGLTWDEKYGKWVESLEWTPSVDGYSTTVDADDAVGQDAAVAVARVRRDRAVPAHHVRRLVRAAAPARGDRRQASASTSVTSACAPPTGRYAGIAGVRASSTRTTRRRDDWRTTGRTTRRCARASVARRRRQPARARATARCSARTSTRSTSTSAPATSPCSRSTTSARRTSPTRANTYNLRARGGARRRHPARALADERHRPHARRQGRRSRSATATSTSR